MKNIIVVLTVSLVLSSFVIAQENEKDSTSFQEVIQTLFSKDGPNLGFLGQFDAEIHDNGNNTESQFNVHLLQLYVYGGFEEKFSYVFQGDLNNGFQLLDFKLSYKLNENWRIDAGQFKAPFGKEFLRNDAKLLFVNRSLAAQTVGPLRQKGVQVNGLFFDQTVSVTGGIFSGSNDRKISLFSGKVGITPVRQSNNSDIQLELSGSMTYSSDRSDLRPLDFYAEVKKFYSADIKFVFKDTRIESEFDVFEHSGFLWKGGYYVDIVHTFGNVWEGAVRMEWFRNDTRLANLLFIDDQIIYRKYIVGVNWYPLKPIKLQLNVERDQINKINAAYLNLQYAINYEH